MKIATVCHPTYGGSGAVAAELAMGLAARGHEAHVVSWEMPFRLELNSPRVLFHQIEVGEYPLFRYPPITLNITNHLIEVVEQYGVEIIHSHYAIPHAVAAWTAREVLRSRGRDVKLACTLHGTDITLVGLERGFFELTRFAIHRQDLLTTPSSWLAGETEKGFGVDAGRIRVIPNAVDLERFKAGGGAEWRTELAPNGERVITHISNFRPVKRVAEVVRAFSALRRHLPAVLCLVGEGPDLPQALHLARELGIERHVRHLGQRRPEPILQASDLFLLPSNAESFGLAALEAMACGVPVIGYAAGGLPEVVEDGVSGILCPVGCDVCMGTLAAGLLADPARYQAMRQAARRRAEVFAQAPVLDAYERELRALLG